MGGKKELQKDADDEGDEDNTNTNTIYSYNNLGTQQMVPNKKPPCISPSS